EGEQPAHDRRDDDRPGHERQDRVDQPDDGETHEAALLNAAPLLARRSRLSKDSRSGATIGAEPPLTPCPRRSYVAPSPEPTSGRILGGRSSVGRARRSQ